MRRGPRPARDGWPRRGRGSGVTQASCSRKAAAHSSRVSRGEGRGQRLPEGRPTRPVLVGTAQRVVGGEPEDVERGQEEPLLDRAHGDPPAVRAGVGVVVGGAGVEQVRAPVEAPHALRTEPLDEPHDRRRGVEDVGVDDLAASARPRLQEGADDAEGHRRRSPAEVTDEVDRRDRSLARTPDRPQRPGEADVVDVVAGHPGPAGRPGRSRSAARRRGAHWPRGTPTGRCPAARPRPGR